MSDQLTPNKDLRKVFRALRKQGFDVAKAGSGHILITPPGPAGAMHRISCSSTPRDPRCLKNLRAELRRAGATV